MAIMSSALSIIMLIGLSSINPIGIVTPYSWQEIEALGGKKTITREGLVDRVQIDLSAMRKCGKGSLTVEYVDQSKTPNVMLGIPVVGRNDNYEFYVSSEAQNQVVLYLLCRHSEFRFALIE